MWSEDIEYTVCEYSLMAEPLIVGAGVILITSTPTILHLNLH